MLYKCEMCDFVTKGENLTGLKKADKKIFEDHETKYLAKKNPENPLLSILPADEVIYLKMGKEIISVILVSMLLGGIIGSILSYIVLNPIIQNLQTELSDTDTKMRNLIKEWHLVTYLKGNSSLVTGTFVIRGKEVRIYWWMSGQGPGSWINIGIYFPNGNFHASKGSSGFTCDLSSDLLIEAGNYYFNITVFEVKQWIIAVWDYY